MKNPKIGERIRVKGHSATGCNINGFKGEITGVGDHDWIGIRTDDPQGSLKCFHWTVHRLNLVRLKKENPKRRVWIEESQLPFANNTRIFVHTKPSNLKLLAAQELVEFVEVKRK